MKNNKLLTLTMLAAVLLTLAAGQDCTVLPNLNNCFNCSTTNATFCDSCLPGWDMNPAAPICDNFTSSSCMSQTTNSSCRYCQSQNISLCAECRLQHLMINGSCTANTTQLCSQQNPGCESCSQVQPGTSLICHFCNSQYTLNQTTQNCYPTQCLQNTSFHCTQCSSTNASQCSTCQDGYFLGQNSGICDMTTIDSCLMGSLSSLLNCQACSQTNHFKCASCKTGFLYNQTDQTCVLAASTNCNLFNQGCNQCTGATAGSFNCSTCGTLYQLETQSNSTRICMPNCQNFPSMNCKSCNPTNYTICGSCFMDAVLLQNGTCHNSSLNFCATLQLNNCTKCTGTYNSSYCQECQQGYNLQNTCVENCLLDASKHCTQCSSANITQCSTCQDGYLLGQNTGICDTTTIDSCIMGSLSSLLNCQTCSQTNHFKCASCKTGFLYNQTNLTCLVAASTNCNLFNSGCNQCTGATAGSFNCSSCGTLYSLETQLNNTRLCMPNCLNYPALNCKSCNYTNYTLCGSCFMEAVLLSNGTCLNSSLEICATMQLYNCTKCSGTYTSSYCQECQQGYNLQNTCVENCLLDTNKHCAQCNTTSITQCGSCKDGYFFDSSNTTCNVTTTDSCKQGVLLAQQCLTCNQNNHLVCQTCSETAVLTQNQKCLNSSISVCSMYINHCSSCNGTFSSLQCFSCQSGYIFNSTIQQCVSCLNDTTSNCKTCNQQNLMQCEVCQDGYVLGSANNCNETTADSCLLGEFYESKQCSNCNQNNSFQCASCRNPGYQFLNTTGICVNSTAQLCSLFISNCSSCNGTYINPQCLSCNSNYSLNNGQCLPYNQCLLNLTTAINCVSCSQTDVTQCSICVDGYFKNTTTNLCTKTTADSCLMGQLAALQQCQTCNASANNLTCATCKYSHLFLNESGICINATAQKCSQYISNCTICNGTVANPQCLSCAQNYTLNSLGQCVQNLCLQNSFTSQNCISCDPSNLTQCGKCVDGYLKNSTTGYCTVLTIDSCLIGTLQSTQQCKTCNSTQMLRCGSCNATNFLLPSGICVQASSQQCMNYISNCTVCNGTWAQSRCLACNPYFGVVAGRCMPFNTCMSNSMLNCKNCSTADVSSCDACNDGYFKYANTSICNQTTTDSCLIGSNLNKLCGTCRTDNHLQCATCQNSSLFLTVNLTCQNALSNSSMSELYCKQGMVGCWQCSGTYLNITCVTCRPGYIMQSGKCLNETAYNCKNQDTNCGYCNPNNITQCSSCLNQYYLNDTTKRCQSCANSQLGQCQSCNLATIPVVKLTCTNCLQGYFLNSTSQICQSCSDTIQGCTNCGINGNQLICWDCGYGNGYNFATKKCQVCSQFTPNCSYCANYWNSTSSLYYTACTSCVYGFTLSANTYTCLSCQQQIPGCRSCNVKQSSTTTPITTNTSELECYDCGSGLYYNRSQPACLLCNKTLSGCSYCYYDSYNWNATTQSYGYQILQCSQCAVSGKQFNNGTRQCETCNISANCYQCSFDSVGKSYCSSCYWGYYFNNGSRQCEPCSSQIQGCQQCTYSPTVSSNITCQSCEWRKYLNTTSNQCQLCNDQVTNCEYCTYQATTVPSSVYCYSCKYGMTYSDILKQCVNCSQYVTGCLGCQVSATQNQVSSVTCYDCGWRYFYSSYTSSCQKCMDFIPGCQSCYAENATSVYCNYCDSRMFFNTDTRTCDYCDNYVPNCDSCQKGKSSQAGTPTSVQCSWCQQGFYLNNTQCSSCGDQFPGCMYCYQSTYPVNEFTCSSCFGEGKYFSLLTKTCKSCSDSVPNCLGCSEYYQYKERTSSQSTTTPSTSTPRFECYWCGQGSFYNNYTMSCDSCAAVTANCKNCWYDHYSKRKPVCSECVTGMYYDSNLEQCITCSSKSPGCSSCWGYYDFATNATRLYCYQCAAGFAKSQNDSNVCVRTMNCQDNCDACQVDQNFTKNISTTVYTSTGIKNVTSSMQVVTTKCTSCAEGFVLKNNTCIFEQFCRPGKFYNSSNCDFCYRYIDDCYTCTRTQNNVVCKSCFNGFELIQSSSANSYTYCNKTEGKKNCPDGCSDCRFNTIDATVQCTSCQIGYYLNASDSSCQLNCTYIGFPNCRLCSQINDTTINMYTSSCDECHQGFAFTNDNKCMLIQNCGENRTFYSYNGSCVNCPSNCLGCKVIGVGSNFKTRCDFCQTGYKATDGVCLRASDSNVNSCPAHCQLCSFQSVSYSMSCSQCMTNYTLIYQYDQGKGQETRACGCSWNCLECVDPKKVPQVCTKCAGQQYRLNKVGQCVYDYSSNCANGTFFDPNLYDERNWANNASYCIACPANCTACQYDNLFQFAVCTYCKTGYKLTDQGTCANKTTATESNCPVGKYENNTMCSDCPFGCAQCNFDTTLQTVACQICKAGYIYTPLGGCQTEASCQRGEYSRQKVDPVDNNCYPCDKTCAYCFFDRVELIQKCAECINNVDYYLNTKGVCISTACPAGSVFSPTVSSGCETCPVQCTKCSRSTTGFISCIDGFCNTGYALNTTSGRCDFNPNYCQNISKVAFLGACRDCPANCSSCSISGNSIQNATFTCQLCQINFSINAEGFCVSNSCSSNQYYGISFTSWVFGCYDCPVGTLSCYFNLNTKKIVARQQGCATNYTYKDGWCYAAADYSAIMCNTSQYLFMDSVQGQICKSCPKSCKTCFYDQARVQCQTCFAPDFVLRLANDKYGICQPNVTLFNTSICTGLAGQYFDYTTKQCASCPLGCSSCSQSFTTGLITTKCLRCTDDFTWYTDYQCYKKCPTGQVSYFNTVGEQLCRSCAENCQLCDIDYSVSPPAEVCYRCAFGFYQFEARCVAAPTCNDGQYLTFTKITTGYLSYNATCLSCPPSCLTCKSTDQYEPYAPITCGSCASNYEISPTNYQCVYSFVNKESDVDCGTNLGFYKYLEKSIKTWVCGECDAGCLSCERKFCFTCNSSYYMVQPTPGTIEQPFCKPVTNCGVGNYFTIEKNCTACPNECVSCTVTNLNDPDNTFSCTQCKTGYQLSPSGKCLIDVGPDGQISSSLCNAPITQPKYAVLVDGLAQCFNCPSSCSNCSLANARQETSTLQCSSCWAGFKLNSANNQCEAICQSGEYIDPTNNQCNPCHFSCKECNSGPYAENCTICQDTYTMEQGLCVLVSQSGSGTGSIGSGGDPTLGTGQPDCGLFAYYDQIAESCICEDSTLYFNETSRICLKAQENVCSIGFYNDLTINACVQCSAKEGQGRCSQCTGELPTNCLECIAGYFLNFEYSCQSCSSGCALCTSLTICDRCAPGYYRYTEVKQGTTGTVSCLSACPAGTLPYMPSLYYLNPEMWSPAELQQQQTSSDDNYVDDPLNADKSALAVSANFHPIFDVLPWEVNNQQPTYKEQKISIECVPCIDHCDSCIADQLFFPHNRTCYAGDYCPGDYVIKLVNKQRHCVLPVAGQFVISTINRPTLTIESAVQPLSKALFIELITTLEDGSFGIISYEWSIVNIFNDVTAIKKVNPKSTVTEKMSTDLVKQVKTKLLDGVALNKKVLNIPQKNLKEFVIVQLQVRATLNYYNSLRYELVEENFKIPIRKIKDYRSTDDLGASPSLITVSPKSGISGVQTFTASYSICNVPAYTRPALFDSTWKFVIEVFVNNASTTQQQSSQCKDSMNINIPANKVKDTNATVLFTFSYGDNYFQASRQLQALANPTYSATTDPKFLKVTNSTQPSVSDLATAASILLNEMTPQTCGYADTFKSSPDLQVVGPCNSTQTNPCCGNGVCVAGTKTLFVCKCNANFSGLFCNIPAISQQSLQTIVDSLISQLSSKTISIANVNSMLTSIKQIAQTTSINSTLMTKLLDQMTAASKVITDTKTLNSLFDTINELTKNQLQTQTTTNVTQANKLQLQAINSLGSAAESSAKLLSPSNPQTTFSAGGITGVNKLISASDLAANSSVKVSLPNTNQNQTLSIGIDKSAMGTSTSVAVSTMVINKGMVNTVVGGNKIVADVLDISLFDTKSNSKLNVSGLTGTCPIRLVLTAQNKSSTSGNNAFKCVYLVPEGNTFRSAGCTVNSTKQNSKTKQYEVVCCCNHLSMFSVDQDTALPTLPVSNYSSEPIDQIASSKLLQAWMTLVAVAAALLILF